jgi:hypothetical protein
MGTNYKYGHHSATDDKNKLDLSENDFLLIILE